VSRRRPQIFKRLRIRRVLVSQAFPSRPRVLSSTRARSSLPPSPTAVYLLCRTDTIEISVLSDSSSTSGRVLQPSSCRPYTQLECPTKLVTKHHIDRNHAGPPHTDHANPAQVIQDHTYHTSSPQAGQDHTYHARPPQVVQYQAVQNHAVQNLADLNHNTTTSTPHRMRHFTHSSTIRLSTDDTTRFDCFGSTRQVVATIE
jgi:hypothetical protein